MPSFFRFLRVFRGLIILNSVNFRAPDIFVQLQI